MHITKSYDLIIISRNLLFFCGFLFPKKFKYFKPLYLGKREARGVKHLANKSRTLYLSEIGTLHQKLIKILSLTPLTIVSIITNICSVSEFSSLSTASNQKCQDKNLFNVNSPLNAGLAL